MEHRAASFKELLQTGDFNLRNCRKFFVGMKFFSMIFETFEFLQFALSFAARCEKYLWRIKIQRW